MLNKKNQEASKGTTATVLEEGRGCKRTWGGVPRGHYRETHWWVFTVLGVREPWILPSLEKQGPPALWTIPSMVREANSYIAKSQPG